MTNSSLLQSEKSYNSRINRNDIAVKNLKQDAIHAKTPLLFFNQTLTKLIKNPPNLPVVN
jgi:hypothetical protein